jgi:hypothetical protein
VKDDIGKKSLELGAKKTEQAKRNREEAALRELRETVATLQAELKVGRRSS